MNNFDKMISALKEFKNSEKKKELYFDDIKVVVKVITQDDENNAYLFAKEYSKQYKDNEENEGFIFVQKLKQETVIRSIVSINDVEFKFVNQEEKEKIIPTLRNIIRDFNESIIDVIYSAHTELMKEYQYEYNFKMEDIIDDVIKEDNEKEEDEKDKLPLESEEKIKTDEEINLDNKKIEDSFNAEIKDGKVIVTTEKDILELKTETSN